LSTEENRGKTVATRLGYLYNNVRDNADGAVMLYTQEAADLLDYIQELEASGYEYGVENTMIAYPHTKSILDNKWFDDKDKADYHMDRYKRMTHHSLTNLRVVKRRKAGPVEDA
jgi:hypothetical protein